MVQKFSVSWLIQIYEQAPNPNVWVSQDEFLVHTMGYCVYIVVSRLYS